MRTIKDADGYATYALVFSPDGQSLLSGGYDGGHSGSARLWEIASGKEKWRFSLGPVRALAFSPDGSQVAVASGDTICLLDARSGTRLHTFHDAGLGEPLALAFSRDAKGLFIASASRVLRRLALPTGKEVCPAVGHTGSVISVAFSPDGTTLASGSRDHSAILWDLASGQPRSILRGAASSRGIASVAFGQDGRRVVTGEEYSGSMQIWDATTGQLQSTHASGGRLVALSPDGQLIASGEGAWRDDSVRLWDQATSQHLYAIKNRTMIAALAFTPDSRILAAASPKTILLWDLKARKECGTLSDDAKARFTALACAGENVLVTGNSAGQVALWDFVSGKRIAVLGTTSGIVCLASAPGGTTLAAADQEGNILLWNPVTRQRAGGWKLPGPTESLAWAPDGRHLAAGNSNGTVYLLRVRSGMGPLPPE
jgi:WD40 repeat protein